MEQRPPFPPFTAETARQKVQLAEDAWNSKDPIRVSMAYTPDTFWRNRTQFIRGRQQVQEFLKGKWEKELDYKLRKELWSFTGNRIAVRFEYDSTMRTASGTVRTAMNCGTSTRTASCGNATPASTMRPSPKAKGD
jgi:nuclear transport factor 2 (NTF2) superfamily protein